MRGAEQVLCLAQAEPLICAVEDWLHGPWVLAPVADGVSAAAGAFRAVVRDPALAPPGTVLTLPLEALLAPPPEALRAPALAWAAQTATVVLGEVPTDALARLQVGALLWLPASFAPAWPVQLRDARACLPPGQAQLDLAAQRLVAGDPAVVGVGDAQPAAGAGLHAVLEHPVQWPLDHWLGWGQCETPFHWPVPQPWTAQLRQGDEVLARGALLPLGAGCGLRIEWLAPSVMAAA